MDEREKRTEQQDDEMWELTDEEASAVTGFCGLNTIAAAGSLSLNCLGG